MEFNIDPKDLNLQDAAGMQLVEVIRNLADESGTADYEDLENLPKINSVVLKGNKTTGDLNISYNDLDNLPKINGVELTGNKTTSDLDIQIDPTDIASAVDDWCDTNVAQETGYVLDSSLTMSNAAAPADKVGELKVVVDAYESRDYLNDALFEMGGISVSDGGYAYPSSTVRVRTKEKVSFHLNVGDVISFKSPVTRFCPFYSVNGGAVTQVGWQTAAYTVATEGDYTFVLSSVQNASEVAPSTPAEFSRAISIATIEQINDDCIWDAIQEVDNIARDAGGGETDSAVTTIVNSVNQAIDGNDIVFVHITDSHVGQSAMPLDRAAKHFAKAMEVAKAVGADFMIHTGDMIQGDGSTVGDNDRKCYGAYMGRVGRYTVPFMWCQGNPNHDYGVTDSDSASGYALNRDIVLALAGRFGKWNTFAANFNDADTVRSYYYFDLPVQQIRIIVLDSDDYGGNRKGWGYNAIQIAWLETVLSDALSKDLPVIVFSHMPPSNNLMPNGVESYGGTGIMSALASFTSDGGTVLAFIYGHVHWDNYYNDTEHGIPYISCTCDLPVASTETFVPTWGTKVVPTRTYGSLTEYAFDVYVINPVTKSTKIFRYGAGSDRSYTY